MGWKILDRKSRATSVFFPKLLILVLVTSLVVLAQEEGNVFNTSSFEQATDQNQNVEQGSGEENVDVETSANEEEETLGDSSDEETEQEEVLDLPEENFEIPLDGLEDYGDDDIVEITRDGTALTKKEYVECRRTALQIEFQTTTLEELDVPFKNKCAHFLVPTQDDDGFEVGVQPIVTEEEIEEYYDSHDDFDDLEFEDLSLETDVNLSLLEGEINGYVIDNQEYVVDVLICDQEQNGCYLKVNGQLTGLLQPLSNTNSGFTFGSEKQYTLQIENIEYNTCGGKRFCNYGYDTFDLTTVTLKGSAGQ